MTQPTLLIDADIAAYVSTSKAEVEVEWAEDEWTLHSDLKVARQHFMDFVKVVTDTLDGNCRIVMCFSDKENFRKELLPSYKANRAKVRKPLAYLPFKEWVKTEFECVIKPKLEADDVMGILATMGKFKYPIIVSADKDLKQIPGTLMKLVDGKPEFRSITQQEADYWHLYQTLVGDVTDNYKGCPGIGDKKASEALLKMPSWDTVMNFYHKAGLTEDDALLQARVARILRASDWDFDKGEIKFWTPSTLTTK